MALVLREADVRYLLTMPETIQTLEQAFSAMAHGTAMNRPRTRLVLANGIMHLLAAAAPALGVLGCKTYTVFRDGVRYVILLFSAQDGQLLALVEADWLGCMRTGGTSGVATKYLARPDASVVGLIGAGTQAMTQLMGIAAVRTITEVNVFSRRLRECEIFCDEMKNVLNVVVRPVASPREAVETADILITATSSPEPVLQGGWLKPGCHINAIGSNWPNRREIDLATLQRCHLIATDSLEQAHIEAGDFIIPAEAGQLDWNNVYDLGDVIVGHVQQRETPDDITLYKGLGIALEDIATAALAYKLALSNGVGEQLDILL